MIHKDCIITEDKIVTVTTSTEVTDRRINYNDILDSIKIEDDDWNEAPWQGGDGWDHYVKDGNYLIHEDITKSRGYVRGRLGNDSLIIIDDDTVVNKWGCNGYHGASKQVRAELIAQVKRKALDQLVEWYTDGWSYYQVSGEYKGYSASICSVDSLSYAEVVKYDIADEIADAMVRDGFIIMNQHNPNVRTHSEQLQYRLDLKKQMCIID